MTLLCGFVCAFNVSLMPQPLMWRCACASLVLYTNGTRTKLVVCLDCSVYEFTVIAIDYPRFPDSHYDVGRCAGSTL